MPDTFGIEKVLLAILYLVLILIAAYFVTKAVGKRAMQRGMKKGGRGVRAPVMGRLLSVEDRIAVDRDKSILVVEFEGKYYLMGATAQELTLIDKIDMPEEALRRAAEENAEEKEEAVGEDGFLRRFCDNMKQESKKRFMKKDEEPGGFTDKLKREIEKDDEKKDT